MLCCCCCNDVVAMVEISTLVMLYVMLFMLVILYIVNCILLDTIEVDRHRLSNAPLDRIGASPRYDNHDKTYRHREIALS